MATAETLNDQLQSFLKSKLSDADILRDASKLLGFLASLHKAYDSTWSEKELWDQPVVVSSLSLGGVSFSGLGEEATPAQLAKAVTQILEENWDEIVRNEKFQAAGVHFDAAYESLDEADRASNAADFAKHLDALLAALNPAAQAKQADPQVFPDSHERELQEHRRKGLDLEKQWDKLGLNSLHESLVERIAKEESDKKNPTQPWSDENESRLQELLDLRQKLDEWRETWQEERSKLVRERLQEYTFLGMERLSRNLFLAVFLEHFPQFKESDLSAVQAAATAFWEDLVRRELPTDDPAFYFSKSVLDAYYAFNTALEEKIGEFSSLASQLQRDIAAALGKTVSPEDAIAADGGGASGEEETSEEQPSDADRLSRLNNRWSTLLQRLSQLTQDLDGVPDEQVLSTVTGDLRRFAQNQLAAAGSLASLDDILSALNRPIAAWRGEKTDDEIDALLDQFVALLEAAAAILASAASGVTPGEAAQKAQDAVEQAQPPAAAPDAEAERDQLADLTKLNHSHAALTAMALAQLEEELKLRGYSEAEIARFLQENQPALAQYLWTQYLAQVQRTEAPALASSDVFRLALNGSLFFADKFELEKGVRNQALGPESLRQGFDGDLSPEMQARLLEIAKFYGYSTPDEMFAALFGNGDRAVARADFLRRAEYAAALTPEKIQQFTRSMVAEYLAGSGVSDQDSLLERLLVSLERDQLSLDQFFAVSSQGMSAEQRLKWQQFKLLIEREQRGQTLTPQEQQRFAELLTEFNSTIILYLQLGRDFHTVRQSEGFRAFLNEASRYGQMEDSLIRSLPEAERSSTRLIPVQLYTPGTAVMTMRVQYDTVEIIEVKKTSLARDNIALQAMIAMSLAEQGSLEYALAYQMMVQAQLAEAGITQPPGNLAALQQNSSWTRRTQQQLGSDGSVGQLTAQAAGGGKASPFNPLGGIKNPALRAALLKKAILLGPPVIFGGLLAWKIFETLKPILEFVQSVQRFFGGGGSSATVSAPTVPSAAGSQVAAAASEAAKDGGSALATNAKAIASDQMANLGSGIKSTGSMISTGLTAITTTAATSGAVVAAGILGPMLGVLTLTVIVWAVIGNSLNDYGGLGVARRGLGIEGCWPTTGTIGSLRNYADGSPHLTSDKGTAIDIVAPALTEIYTPFGGRARAFAEDPTAPPRKNNGGYGNYVRVYTSLGFDLIFAHMSVFDIPDAEQIVVAGQLIGGVGTTGKSSGNHLHYELVDVQSRGIEVFDVTPLPEESITLGMAVSAYECAGITPRDGSGDSPSATTPPVDPSQLGDLTQPFPPTAPPSGVDPAQLGDLTQPFPTTPPQSP